MNILAVSIVVSISTLLGIIIGILVEKDKKKSINNVHFYVARDEDETLWLYFGKPERKENEFGVNRVIYGSSYFKDLGLNVDDYKDLRWEDEPVEVFLNIKD